MIVFVGGTHGSGKSELCKGFIQTRENEWSYRSASELIEGQLGGRNWDDSKQIAEVGDNQRLLLLALEHEKALGKNLLLDGHFVLKGPNESIVPIPGNVFRAVRPCGVVLVEAPPSLILARLRRRDIVESSEQKVLQLMQLERQRATQVCQSLNLPLKIVFLPTIDQFVSAVEMLLCGE